MKTERDRKGNKKFTSTKTEIGKLRAGLNVAADIADMHPSQSVVGEAEEARDALTRLLVLISKEPEAEGILPPVSTADRKATQKEKS